MVPSYETMESAAAHKLLDNDIERARLLLGVDLASRDTEHHTVVSVDGIRNFAEGYGDDNPLYVNENYGLGTRWGSLVAPPIMAAVVNSPMRGDSMSPDLKSETRGLFRGVHVFVSGGSWHFYKPLRVGDRLLSFGGQETLEVKKSEFAKRMVIRVRRFVKINQLAEVVAVQRVLTILTERSTAAEEGKYSDIEEAHYSDEQLASIDEIYEGEGPRGDKPRLWEDVKVDDELPPMVKGPLTITDIVMFHAGGYGKPPYYPSATRLGYKNRKRIPAFYVKDDHGIPQAMQSVHWSDALARSIGNPRSYDYGVLRECWFHHMLTDWVGDDGWVLEQNDSIRRFNYLGDTQFLSGRVIEKFMEAGRPLVKLALTMTNQRGEETSTCEAIVGLPSSEQGQLLLPPPPEDLQRRAAVMWERHLDLARASRA